MSKVAKSVSYALIWFAVAMAGIAALFINGRFWPIADILF
jgi:hypothetical protein